MKALFALVVCVFSLYAQTLDDLVNYSLEHHTSLKSLQERLSALENEKSATRNFDDPTVALSVNDIQFDAPTDRTLEAMQSNAITIQQKIPYFGKRDAKTQMVISKEKLLQMNIEQLKSELKKQIKITAYALWETRQRIQIVNSYIDVIKENISLNEAYNVTADDTQLALMSAKLALSRQKIQKVKFQTLQNALLAKLAYLSGQQLSDLQLSLQVTQPQPLNFYVDKVDSSSILHVKSAQVEVQKAQLHISELSSKIDPFIQAGYYYRENHPDYASVTIGASLPLYGTQKEEQEAQRKQLLAQEADASDTKNRVGSEVSGLYEQLQEQFQTYTIIKEESLPQIKHLFALQQSSLKNGDTLFQYIDILTKKLALDEELVKATAKFNQTQAMLDALTGE